ncbi:MAG: hypothetical protein PHH67_02390 [Methanosarcina sp.]|jgi:hypothetical protein|nr:hypothetical protein [Methanosarcina sp.]MDD3317374.1 hypothetical protein [Methanosarcina sp.]MDD4305355.1 hypothetical protein [Methanosarcina sp.]MDD4619574.1 hypothetical protein [Methanosarcina sp.]
MSVSLPAAGVIEFKAEIIADMWGYSAEKVLMAKGDSLFFVEFCIRQLELCLILIMRKGTELVEKIGGNSNGAIQTF